MTKWPVQKLTQGTTQKLLQHHDATDTQKTYTSVPLGFFFFHFLPHRQPLKGILQEMLSYRPIEKYI